MHVVAIIAQINMFAYTYCILIIGLHNVKVVYDFLLGFFGQCV